MEHLHRPSNSESQPQQPQGVWMQGPPQGGNYGGGYQPPIPPPQGPYGPGQAPNAGNKLAAGLSGIFLGAFGVHKFILGYTTEGIIMLLITTVGFLPSCGTSPYIIGLIGLIEGIVYLAKNDHDFVQTYVTGRRPWF